MSTTLATLRTALTKRLNIPVSGDGTLDNTAITECLNLGLSDIATEHHWPWMLASASLTFVSGVASIASLSPAMGQARELVINGNRAKRASSLANFIDTGADGNSCLWYEVGTNIQLAPAPVSTTISTAVLYYLRTPAVLAAAGDTIVLPDQYVNSLIARASYHANLRRSSLDRAAQDNGEYLDQIKKMKASYPSRSGPRTIRPAGASYWAVWS